MDQDPVEGAFHDHIRVADGLADARQGRGPTAPEARTAPTDRERAEAAIRLLRLWAEDGDAQEQQESLEHLKRAIDENRPGERKFFS